MGLNQKAGGPAGAEFSLAGAHANACAAAEVREGAHFQALDSGIDLPYRHLLALADEGFVPAVTCADAGGAGTHAGCCGLLGHGGRFPNLLGHGLVGFLLRTGKRRSGGFARLVDAQFPAHRIGGHLRHEPIGHEFAAGDGHKALQAVAGFVVQADDAAGYVAPGRVVVGAHERAYAGISPENSGR